MASICPTCKEHQIPIMSLKCPHSFCGGCIRQQGKRQQQHQQRQQQKPLIIKKEEEDTKKNDDNNDNDDNNNNANNNENDTSGGNNNSSNEKIPPRDNNSPIWLPCPECGVEGAFDARDTSSRVNLKACQLMQCARYLELEIEACKRQKRKREKQQRQKRQGAQGNADDDTMERQRVLVLQEHKRQLLESLQEKQDEVDALKRKVQERKLELAAIKENNKRKKKQEKTKKKRKRNEQDSDDSGSNGDNDDVAASDEQQHEQRETESGTDDDDDSIGNNSNNSSNNKSSKQPEKKRLIRRTKIIKKRNNNKKRRGTTAAFARAQAAARRYAEEDDDSDDNDDDEEEEDNSSHSSGGSNSSHDGGNGNSSTDDDGSSSSSSSSEDLVAARRHPTQGGGRATYLDGLFEKRIRHLKDFKEQHGHIRISCNPEQKSLYKWLRRQINLRDQGELTKYRRKLLESVLDEEDEEDEEDSDRDQVDDESDNDNSDQVDDGSSDEDDDSGSDEDDSDSGTGSSDGGSDDDDDTRVDDDDDGAKEEEEEEEQDNNNDARRRKSFDERLDELKAYKAEHGNFDVSIRHEGGLGKWLCNIRGKKYRNELKPSKVAVFDELPGFDWKIGRKQQSQQQQQQRQRAAARQLAAAQAAAAQAKPSSSGGGGRNTAYDEVFDNHCRKLEEFYEKYGHCKVPHSYDPFLYSWNHNQRARHKQGLLKQERVDRLNKMGFDWSSPNKSATSAFGDEWETYQVPRSERAASRRDNRTSRLDEWDMRIHQLLDYHGKHGHCNVRGRAVAGLRTWVLDQRKAKKRGALSEERVEVLSAIGFDWEDSDDKEEEGNNGLAAAEEEQQD